MRTHICHFVPFSILGPVFHWLRGSWEALQGQAGQNSPEVRSGGDRAGQNSCTYRVRSCVGLSQSQVGKQFTSAPYWTAGAAGVPRHNQDEVGTLSWAPPQEVTSKP